jgi:hypothetical protein
MDNVNEQLIKTQSECIALKDEQIRTMKEQLAIKQELIQVIKSQLDFAYHISEGLLLNDPLYQDREGILRIVQRELYGSME